MDVTCVQNRESWKDGRQRAMGMASKIEDEMEMDATYGHDRRPKFRR